MTSPKTSAGGQQKIAAGQPNFDTKRRATLQLLLSWAASTSSLAAATGGGDDGDFDDEAPTAEEIDPAGTAQPYPAPPGSSPSAALAAPQASPGPAKATLPIGALAARPLDQSKLVLFRKFNEKGRYTRFIRNEVLGVKADIEFIPDSRTAAAKAFHSRVYTLTCDGASLATARPVAGTTRAMFKDVDLSGVADGWHLFDIVPGSTGETAVPLWMYVLKSGSPKEQSWAPVQTGSFGLQREEQWIAKWGRLPVRISATGSPIALRKAMHFSHAATPAELFRRDLAPCINGDPPYLYRHARGFLTCLGMHGYAWSTLVDKLPTVILRDGPRGIGTVVGPTHVEMGSAAPNGALRGTVYFTDSWRFGKVKANGEVVTLAGWRHTLDGIELVGDWSAIPQNRRGFHELWGMAWDERTFPTDETAAPIRSENNEKPHVTGVVAFVADSQNKRVCKLQFDPRSHATPVKVTEFVTGLNDPWDVVYYKGMLLISVRKDHRIVAYDATTGQYLKTIVAGAALTDVDRHRFVRLLATQTAIRAERCVAPEGLFVQDDWLYFGSVSMRQVRRIHLVTGVLQVVATIDDLPGKPNYFKIAVSDGTFGPRGSIFVAMWDVDKMGGPHCFLPDGTPWSIWTRGSHAAPEGRGGRWRGLGYSTCVGVGFGRLLCGSADYGLVEISLAQASDPPVINEKLYEAGRAEYEAAGSRLTHGIDGYGHYGYALPWGRSAAVDYYLSQHGHRKTIA